MTLQVDPLAVRLAAANQEVWQGIQCGFDCGDPVTATQPHMGACEEPDPGVWVPDPHCNLRDAYPLDIYDKLPGWPEHGIQATPSRVLVHVCCLEWASAYEVDPEPEPDEAPDPEADYGGDDF